MGTYSGQRSHEHSLFALLAYLCVLLSALRALIPLNWYPPVFIDEPFFCLSAIRVLDGKSSTYAVHMGAPWSGQAWGYHSPFTFRLLLLPVMAFGPSLFACRLLPCLLAHLAIFLLVRWIVREMQSPLGGLIFALAWCAGFSFLQTLWARPEGLSLFFLTLGFLALYRGLTNNRIVAMFLAGLALGCSVGCSISGIWFCVTAALLTIGIRAGLKQSLLRPVCALGIGGVAAACLFLAAWIPDIAKCWDQFWWFVSLHKHSADEMYRSVAHVLFGGFRLRSLWFLGLALCSMGLTVYAVFHVGKAVRWYRSGASRNAVPFTMAAAFSLTGCVVFVASSLQYYYLVYAEVWTQLFLSMFLTVGRVLLSRRKRALAFIALVLMAVPSSIWSVMRTREAFVVPFGRETDRVSVMLKAMDHSDGWFIDPQLFVLAEQAGLSYEPLPWFGTVAGLDIPPECRLLVRTPYFKNLRSQCPREMSRRTVRTIEMFEGNEWFADRIYVLGAKPHERSTARHGSSHSP